MYDYKESLEQNLFCFMIYIIAEPDKVKINVIISLNTFAVCYSHIFFTSPN